MKEDLDSDELARLRKNIDLLCAGDQDELIDTWNNLGKELSQLIDRIRANGLPTTIGNATAMLLNTKLLCGNVCSELYGDCIIAMRGPSNVEPDKEYTKLHQEMSFTLS